MIQPRNNYVLGTHVKTDTKTKSGLIIPEASQKRISITTILAVGEGVKDCKVGDRVIYKDYTQNEFKFDNVEYLLIEDNDILALVED